MKSKNFKKIAIRLAGKILNNEIEYIVGCREICRLLSKIYDNPYDKGFDIFFAIETQTDHLPAGQFREFWNKESLKIKDKEIQDKYIFFKKDLIEGCENIIKCFS